MIGVEEKWKVPNLTESVSETADGTLHLTITNLSVIKVLIYILTIIDRSVKTVKGEIVMGEQTCSFEEPECVTIKKYDGTQITEKESVYDSGVQCPAFLESEVEWLW